MAPKNTEGSSGSLTLASGGLGPSLGWRQCRAGLPLAGARAGAVGGAKAIAELPEAGSAAALLLATVLRQDVVVAAVVTEDAAADPGAKGAQAVRVTHCGSHNVHWALDAIWLSSDLALPSPRSVAFPPI